MVPLDRDLSMVEVADKLTAKEPGTASGGYPEIAGKSSLP